MTRLFRRARAVIDAGRRIRAVWARTCALIPRRPEQTFEMAPAPDTATERDRELMGLALERAREGLGRTAPNPSVGAVVYDSVRGEIVASAVTAFGGRPHAEPLAIAAAGRRARGATIYVTLEPCSHFGRTPPCADAIVAAGIARAVIGITDPDPRVAGRGIARLEAAGIAVTRGVLAEEAAWVTRGHILRVTERRPFVQLKLALGADGEVPRGRAGVPTWVTGPEARAEGHRLRAEADALLVGRATVLDDDPELTCRLQGLEDRSPIRVVLARGLDVPLGSKVVRTARTVPVWIVGAAGADADRRAGLEEAGCQILTVPEVGGRLWLPAVTEALAARGVTRLLVEGGPQVWAAFARAGLVDEVVAFAAGIEGRDEVLRQALRRWVGPVADALRLEGRRAAGSDTVWTLRRR